MAAFVLYGAVATFCYYEKKVCRMLGTAIVSYLLKQVYCGLKKHVTVFCSILNKKK